MGYPCAGATDGDGDKCDGSFVYKVAAVGAGRYKARRGHGSLVGCASSSGRLYRLCGGRVGAWELGCERPLLHKSLATC